MTYKRILIRHIYTSVIFWCEGESTFLWKWIATFFGGQFLQCIQNYAFLAPIFFMLVSHWEELHPLTDPPTYDPQHLSILLRSACKWLSEYSGMMNWATSDLVNGFPFLSSSEFPNRLNTEKTRCYLTPFIFCDSLDDMRKSNTTVTRHEQPILIIGHNFGGPRASGPSVETHCFDCCVCCKAPKCNCSKAPKCECCKHECCKQEFSKECYCIKFQFCKCHLFETGCDLCDCCFPQGNSESQDCLSCCDCFPKEDFARTAVAATSTTVGTGMAAAGLIAAAARQQQYQTQH